MRHTSQAPRVRSNPLFLPGMSQDLRQLEQRLCRVRPGGPPPLLRSASMEASGMPLSVRILASQADVLGAVSRERLSELVRSAVASPRAESLHDAGLVPAVGIQGMLTMLQSLIAGQRLGQSSRGGAPPAEAEPGPISGVVAAASSTPAPGRTLELPEGVRLPKKVPLLDAHNLYWQRSGGVPPLCRIKPSRHLQHRSDRKAFSCWRVVLEKVLKELV